jgi:hypothetical protein
VRKAALSLARALRSVSLRVCDVTNGAPQGEAARAVAVLLPLLLQSGLPSNVPEVKALSVDLLAKIIQVRSDFLTYNL